MWLEENESPGWLIVICFESVHFLFWTDYKLTTISRIKDVGRALR